MDKKFLKCNTETKTIYYKWEDKTMKNLATRKATKQLQKVFDFMGNYGGQVVGDSSEKWFRTFRLEVKGENESKKDVAIYYYYKNGDEVVCDPYFSLSLTMDGDRIAETEIIEFEHRTFCRVLPATYNKRILKKSKVVEMFSLLMKEVAEAGPYLSNPDAVIKFSMVVPEYPYVAETVQVCI